MADDWWTKPYRGGPLVPCPGFPRELRVGDEDGEDVIAYKRTVWRAGRWQGPASRFDDTFSKAFSTGAGPNVVDTGIAGVQRQQNMPDTGIVDERTFNTLRSIRVPEGRAHAGEMAMDANAANLIALAYQRFQQPPRPPSSAKARLDEAARWIGYTEEPAGSNHTTFGAWYGMDAQPYCAMFVTYCDQCGGSPSASFVRGSRYAYVPYMVTDARNNTNGFSVPESPEPGDLVAYDWASDGTYDHVGLFERWTGISPSSFSAIEANTSPDDQGSQSNGGGVYRRTRDTRNQATTFIRVAER